MVGLSKRTNNIMLREVLMGLIDGSSAKHFA